MESAKKYESFSQEEKVKILLAEYTCLRQEINARVPIWFQLFAITAILLGWEVAYLKDHTFLYAVLVTSSLSFVAGRLLYRDVEMLVSRLMQLERDINNRAGETLLVWETKRGAFAGGKRQYWFRKWRK